MKIATQGLASRSVEGIHHFQQQRSRAQLLPGGVSVVGGFGGLDVEVRAFPMPLG